MKKFFLVLAAFGFVVSAQAANLVCKAGGKIVFTANVTGENSIANAKVTKAFFKKPADTPRYHEGELNGELSHLYGESYSNATKDYYLIGEPGNLYTVKVRLATPLTQEAMEARSNIDRYDGKNNAEFLETVAIDIPGAEKDFQAEMRCEIRE